MKKLIILLLLILANPAVAETTFKIATVAPAGTAWMKEMRSADKNIRQRTDNRVKLKFYPGGVMGSPETVLKKIRIGQLHGAALTSGDVSSINKNAQLYNLPFLFKNYDEVTHVRKELDKELRKLFNGTGLTVAGIASGGFAYFMSSEPILELSDIQKRKTWIPEGDSLSAVTYETMNVSPISLSIADTFTGLQTGMIDTVPTTFMGAVAFQWHTKLNYVTNIPTVYVNGMMMLSEKRLNKLSDADRAVVLEEMNASFNRLDKQNELDEANAAEALKSQGLKFIKPNAEQMKQWQRITDESRNTLIRDYGLSKPLINKLQTALSEYRSSVAQK